MCLQWPGARRLLTFSVNDMALSSVTSPLQYEREFLAGMDTIRDLADDISLA